MLLNLITIFSKYFYSYFSSPFIKLWCFINFFIKYIFFGSENAFISLSRYDKFNLQLIMKLLGAKIGENCVIESGIRFHNCKNFKNLKIGNNCHIGKDCFFDLRDSVSIGNNVVISMNNTFITHMDMNNSNLRELYPASQAPINVKDDSYIGSNCIILMGVSIEKKVIVGANSLVNEDLLEKAIYAGSPASKLKQINGI